MAKFSTSKRIREDPTYIRSHTRIESQRLIRSFSSEGEKRGVLSCVLHSGAGMLRVCEAEFVLPVPFATPGCRRLFEQ